jgi:hypothetical protein
MNVRDVTELLQWVAIMCTQTALLIVLLKQR